MLVMGLLSSAIPLNYFKLQLISTSGEVWARDVELIISSLSPELPTPVDGAMGQPGGHPSEDLGVILPALSPAPHVQSITRPSLFSFVLSLQFAPCC